MDAKLRYKIPFPVAVFNKELTPPVLEMHRVYSYPILPLKPEEQTAGNDGDTFDDGKF